MMEDDVLEISPLAYMRGRTFKRVFLIADEMQNSTPNQMLMLLTRIGEGSRLVITGDLLQKIRIKSVLRMPLEFLLIFTNPYNSIILRTNIHRYNWVIRGRG